MPATWIADALRTGGCAVNEAVVPDWKTRGHTDGPRMDTVVGVMGHHTAGAATGNLPSLGIVRDGRPDLAGPLANLMLARDGTWVPIAAGRPWHAGGADKPAAWPWIPNGDANGCVLGIEAESTGTSDDWTVAQRIAYPQGVAALLRYRGLGADRFLGHKEWAPSRKSDPAFWDMNAFRASVTAILNGADMPLSQADLDAIWNYSINGVRARDRVEGVDRVQLPALAAAVADVRSKVVVEQYDLAGRPADRKDDLLGHVLSTEARVKALATAPSAAVNVDPAALAAALLSDEASIARLGDAIAAGLAKRVGNG